LPASRVATLSRCNRVADTNPCLGDELGALIATPTPPHVAGTTCGIQSPICAPELCNAYCDTRGHHTPPLMIYAMRKCRVCGHFAIRNPDRLMPSLSVGFGGSVRISFAYRFQVSQTLLRKSPDNLPS